MVGLRKYLFVSSLLLACRVNEALDIKEWMGEEPMTAERIVKEVVEHFSQPDPQGIPVLKIPPVIEIPDEITASQITFQNMKISGHSNLRLEYINLNFTTFSGIARLSLPLINVVSEYQWPGWWSTSEGDTNITMTGIQIALQMNLGVSDLGVLLVENLEIILNYEQLELGFEGLVTEHSLAIGTADLFFGTVIQPLIVGSLQEKVRGYLNWKLEEKLGHRSFPDSISPMDFAVAKIRTDLREKGMDPFDLGTKDINLAWGVTAQLKNIKVLGLTTIHRSHEISAQFIDNAIFATIQLGTQEVKASADWTMSAALLPAIGGHLDVEVESLDVTVEAKQPANIRSPPVLRKIDVRLGNLAVRSAGEGTMDYLVELLVNIVPNSFRNIIMDRVEPRLQQVIQKQLNRLDIYGLVMKKLAENAQQDAQAAQPTS